MGAYRSVLVAAVAAFAGMAKTFFDVDIPQEQIDAAVNALSELLNICGWVVAIVVTKKLQARKS